MSPITLHFILSWVFSNTYRFSLFSSALKTHKTVHASSPSHVCVCGASFKLRASYMDHIRRIHQAATTTTHVCKLCFKTFHGTVIFSSSVPSSVPYFWPSSQNCFSILLQNFSWYSGTFFIYIFCQPFFDSPFRMILMCCGFSRQAHPADTPHLSPHAQDHILPSPWLSQGLLHYWTHALTLQVCLHLLSHCPFCCLSVIWLTLYPLLTLVKGYSFDK